MKSTFTYTSFVIALTLIESISAQPLGRREASKLDVNKCLRANNLNYGWVNKTDAKVPPCWIENGGKYDCYEYKSGKQCDKWPGMFDITKGSNKPESYKSTDPSAIYLTPQQLEEGIKGLKIVFEVLEPENPQKSSPIKLNGPKLFQAREYLYSITHLIHPEKQNDTAKNDPTAIVFEGKVLEEIQRGYELACQAFLIDDKDHDGKVDELPEVVIDWDKLLELTHAIDVANQDLISKSNRPE
ncbi:hypothetical protein K502DRAFT_328788 [Neoconidiobolus thromboides FSU 785]|nr:hypothetical protein K502DRAFT_328788 [Neoconidiobolus thromboides FSU 785]